MSVKRIFGVTAFGTLIVAAVIGAMLLISYLKRDFDAVSLPDTSPPPVSVSDITEDEADEWGRIEVTKDTVQSVVMQTLSRPDTYSRNVTVITYWESGQAVYNISVNVS